MWPCFQKPAVNTSKRPDLEDMFWGLAASFQNYLKSSLSCYWLIVATTTCQWFMWNKMLVWCKFQFGRNLSDPPPKNSIPSCIGQFSFELPCREAKAFAQTGEMDCHLAPDLLWAGLKHQSRALWHLLHCCCYCLNTKSVGNNPVYTIWYIDGNEKIGNLIWPYFIWKCIAFHPFARYWLWYSMLIWSMLFKQYLDLIQMSWVSEICVCLHNVSNIY